MTQSSNTLSTGDLPSLYATADEASRRSQIYYYICVIADLILIVGAAIMGSIAFASQETKECAAWISASLAGGGIVLTILIKSKTFEQDWYDGRAIAESIKTRAWRFMMKTEPYEQAANDVDSAFVTDLEGILMERKRFSTRLASDTSQGLISDRMRTIRSMSFKDRTEFYSEHRILDQKKWYSKKSRSNLRWGNIWFAALLTAQGLLLISCFAIIKWPGLPVNYIGIFSAVAAALVAWSQLKRYQELANSYGLAANELALIDALKQGIHTESSFSQYVLDAENAISREHTLWKARRDKT